MDGMAQMLDLSKNEIFNETYTVAKTHFLSGWPIFIGEKDVMSVGGVQHIEEMTITIR